jgi:hypothetical protein
MSFWCHASNELVSGESRVLVPIHIRKVIYIAQNKPDAQSDYLQFASQSEGWEIVTEVAVRASKATEFALMNTPDVVAEKEVRYLLPRKTREKFVRRNDEDNDKPEA